MTELLAEIQKLKNERKEDQERFQKLETEMKVSKMELSDHIKKDNKQMGDLYRFARTSRSHDNAVDNTAVIVIED